MAVSGGGSMGTSLPVPRPKSPPRYPDLYGKRRQLAKVQVLEREIGFLEEELKSVQSIRPVSQHCKEIVDFVVENSDPLIPTSQKIRRSHWFWKWLCGSFCFNIPWICCCQCGCCHHLEMPCGCNCNLCNFDACLSCSMPKCRCCSWLNCKCLHKPSCSCNSCTLESPSCPHCSCCRCTCRCLGCPKLHLCSCSTKNCCHTCCFCC